MYGYFRMSKYIILLGPGIERVLETADDCTKLCGSFMGTVKHALQFLLTVE